MAYGRDLAEPQLLRERLAEYVGQRRNERAAEGSIRIGLALLNRALALAVQQKRLSPRSRPFIELPPNDPQAVRKGFSGERQWRSWSIESGVDVHAVMPLSGHVTQSVIRRYHIIGLDRMREAALTASRYSGEPPRVHRLASTNS